MTVTHPVAEHPQDGELVRYLDHQAAEDERRRLQAHLAACAVCSRRLRGLQEQSGTVSGLMGTLDVVPDQLTRARALAAVRRAEAERLRSRRWYASPSVRVAAVVTLAAMGTLGVGPVRAWVGERFAGLFGDEPVVVQPAAPAPALERGSVVNFAPAGETFNLEIRHAQSVGAVTLQRAQVEEVSAQTINAADEMFLVMPAGLRVENSPGSQASYRLVIPTSVTLIQVFSGGKLVAVLPVEGAELPWERVIPLDPQRAGR